MARPLEQYNPIPHAASRRKVEAFRSALVDLPLAQEAFLPLREGVADAILRVHTKEDSGMMSETARQYADALIAEWVMKGVL